MNFPDFIKSFFGASAETIYITDKAIAVAETNLAIKEFALASAINLIANAISKCEFKTFIAGEEIKKEEYYLWNIEPNINQNSSQFWNEVITKAIGNGSSLVIDVHGQMIIADGFTKSEYAVQEDTFVGVSRGTMSFYITFPMSQVLYFRFSDAKIDALLAELMSDYAALLSMAIGKYKRSGGRKGILDIDSTASNDKAFQQTLDDLMNLRFKKYFESENAVLPLKKGFTYEEKNGDGSKKSTSEIVDITSLTKEAMLRTAQAFNIPPALLSGEIAEVDQVLNAFLTFCIDPKADLLAEEITRKRFGKDAYLKGSYVKIDTSGIKHIDLFSIATSFDKLIASGGYSIDELRVKSGDVALNTEWSKKHYLTKNYEDIAAATAATGKEVKL